MLESDFKEMRNIQKEVVQIEFNDIDTIEMNMAFELEKNVIETKGDKYERTKNMLKEATEFNLMLADIYYKEQLKIKTKVVFSKDVSMENDDI